MVSCTCPECGKTGYVPERHIGKTVQCPQCRARIRVPIASVTTTAPQSPPPEPIPRETPSAAPQISLRGRKAWMLPAGALVLVAVFASAIFFTVSGPSGQAKHKAAIEKVLAQWDAIRERGLAKQTSGIDEIIANARSMVRSGKAIDASGCPEEFLLAWGDYLRDR